jgi:2-oxoglutarate dehydrogenase E2 component (dihydrolipoamide succinyltransferase)
MKEVKMPKMGITMTSGTLTSWKKKVGDKVDVGEPLYELETDKQTIVIESPFAGTLSEIILAEGDSADVDVVIAKIED